MSRRPVINPNIGNPLTHTMAATFNGSPTNIGMLPGISYDLSWSGTPTGTFSVQVSNSYVQAPDGSALVAGNWTALPATAFSDTLPAPGGSSGIGFINVLPNIQAEWIRLVYTRTSGTGTLTTLISAKVQ